MRQLGLEFLVSVLAYVRANVILLSVIGFNDETGLQGVDAQYNFLKIIKECMVIESVGKLRENHKYIHK